MTEGISMASVAVALERVETVLADNKEVKEDLKKIKTSIRSMETLLHESTAATLGLAAVVSAMLAKNPITDEEIQTMLDRLTPQSDLGTLNRERAQTLYGSIMKAASGE